MKLESFEDVWDAIEQSPENAQNMRLRSELMIALDDRIKANKWTQAKAAEVMGVTQPRISDLMRGKIDLFGLESLVEMAAKANLRVSMSIKATEAA